MLALDTEVRLLGRALQLPEGLTGVWARVPEMAQPRFTYSGSNTGTEGILEENIQGLDIFKELL